MIIWKYFYLNEMKENTIENETDTRLYTEHFTKKVYKVTKASFDEFDSSKV